MASKTINGVPVEDIVNHLEINEDLVERIAYRKVKAPELAIVEPDPEWPKYFQGLRSRIVAALEQRGVDRPSPQAGGGDTTADQVTVLAINHVGSTSVPGLPAKAVIDIDLVLSSNTLAAEHFYVPRLEAAGFQYLLREPAWYGHRFFAGHKPISCNLHVWGPRCPEVERHRILRDWLREHEDDRELYARTKREVAAVSREKGEDMMKYNSRKEKVILGILTRAYTALGYV